MTADSGNEVLVLTQQGLSGAAARSLANANHFEAEDVLVDCGGVDRLFFAAEDDDLDLRMRRHLGGVVRTVRPGACLPRLRRSGPRLTRDYRVAIALVRTVWDVTLLETVVDLRRRADTVVVWIFEMWPSGAVPALAKLPFHLVDLVLVGTTAEAASKLDQLVAPPVHFMPAGIDIDTFGISDVSLDRPTDLMNIGRRDPDFHARFLERSISTGLGYHFDTTAGAKLVDHREHRWLLAQHYRRSKVAMTCAAKFDVIGPDQALRAVPNRMFEAMAAGTLMVGFPPPSEMNQLAQAGAVVVDELPGDPADAVAQVERLIESEHTEQRRELASLARRNHDWSARWLHIFGLMDAPPPAGILQRNSRMMSSPTPR